MPAYADGSGEEFEAWIRKTIGGGFYWKIRPRDNTLNRVIVADSIEDAIERNDGTFPEMNTFIERAE